MSLTKALEPLKHAKELFSVLSEGRHLDASQDPEMWSALCGEHHDQYARLFEHLGQKLVRSARGYAYFEIEDSESKGTRPLALLYLLVFQKQVEAGLELHAFDQWHLDDGFLQDLRRKNHEILRGENLESDERWRNLLNRARSLGFFAPEGSGYRLLPATWRFLDLFLELAEEARARGDELDAVDAEPETDSEDPDDEP